MVAQGETPGVDIDSSGGWATFGLAVLTTAGLAVVAWRGLRARPVLEHTLSEGLGAGWRAAIDAGSLFHPLGDAAEVDGRG